MQLAINTLVIIILSLVILVGGLGIVTKFYNERNEVIRPVDEMTRQQLTNLLLSTKERIVVLPPNVREAERGETAFFPVAIQNTLEKEETFRVEASEIVSGPEECTRAEKVSWCPEAFYIEGPYPLERAGTTEFQIGVAVKKESWKGEYAFLVSVKAGEGRGEEYASAKVIVRVP